MASTSPYHPNLSKECDHGPMDAITLNEILGISNINFEAKIWESDLRWEAKYLSLKGKAKEVKWYN